MRDQRLAGNGGRWGDKFLRADRKWQSWQMRDYSGDARVFPIVTEEKARLFPNRIALHFGETSFSYEALHLAVNRYANGFLALGIRPGDRVALMLPNCPEALFAWWGLSRIGAVDVPVNTALRGEGLAWQIGQARCVALMIGHDLLDRLEPVLDDLPLLRTVLVRGGSALPQQLPREVLALSHLNEAPETTPTCLASHRDLASIIYTSGTTGRSKGVMMSHDYWYQIAAEAVRYARYTEEDRLYTGLPLFHISARATTVAPALLADASAVVAERFSASRMLDDCRRWECSSAKYIGGILPILINQAERPDDGDNPLRLMVGAAAPAGLFAAFEERFNTRLLEGYGSTEAALCLMNPFDARRPGSCGQPITGWDVMIADNEDRPCATGQTGQILARPQRPGLGTMGYDGLPGATADLMRDGWIHSGDLGYRDGEGYFYFVDRKSQALRRRGENISSFEVEAALCSHPSVLEACVVGVPSEIGEDDVKAVVVLRPGEDVAPKELTDWCQDRLAYFAIPRYIALRGHLPKTPSFRVEKHRLKAEGVTADCWDREAAGVVLAR